MVINPNHAAFVIIILFNNLAMVSDDKWIELSFLVQPFTCVRKTCFKFDNIELLAYIIPLQFKKSITKFNKIEHIY